MKKKVLIGFAVFVACLYIFCAFMTKTDYTKSLREFNTGFNRLGKDYDTIFEIHDYYIDNEGGYSYITVYNLDNQGLFFDDSYVADLDFYSSTWMREEDWCHVYYSDLEEFEVVNRTTITIGKDEDECKFILQDVLEKMEIGRIYKVNEDRFGEYNDRNNVLYFAVKYEELKQLQSEDFGEISDKEGFTGYKERKIYF